MIFITAFSTIIVCVYILFALWWLLSLKSVDVSRNESPGNTIRVSVVIPFRNEASSLPGLINDLRQQDYPGKMTEFIFIDDHSIDNSAEIISGSNWLRDQSFQLLKNESGELGKKAALKNGLKAARGTHILQTDADCRLGAGWISSMLGCFTSDNVAMVLGSVIMKPSGNFWSGFAALEFMSLQAVGAAMAIAGRPIMGSAANMAYTKELGASVRNGGNRASGDDVFLIQGAAAHGEVKFNLDGHSTVETASPQNLGEFLNQRARWGGKTASYTSRLAKGIAFLVATMALWQITLLILTIVYPLSAGLYLGLWILKLAVDYPLLRFYSQKTGQQKLMRLFLTASFIYPFYILATGIMILFVPVKWKERSIRPVSD